MNEKQAEKLMAALIFTRSSGYLFSKTLLHSIGPMSLLALRFLLAFLLLSVLFHKKWSSCTLEAVRNGAVVGGLFFLVMTFEALALQRTATSTTSFLENTAIIFVPIFNAVLERKRLSVPTIVSCLLAISGVGMLTLSGQKLYFSEGEILCLVAAVFYASAIIATARLSKKTDSVLLGILQLGFLGLFAACGAGFSGSFSLPARPIEYGALACLVFLCTGFGFTMQPVAQSHMRAERAGLFCALNPAFASILGVAILHEPFTANRLIGAFLILSSLFLPQLISMRKTKVPKKICSPI